MGEMNQDTVYALLREIKEVAMEASLTGAMRKGSRVLIDVYNRCRTAIAEQGDNNVLTLFPELSPETDGVDDVGMSAALLARYARPAKHAGNGRGHCHPNEDEDL